MFYFTTDHKRPKLTYALKALRAWGQPRISELGNAWALWVDDGFTHISKRKGYWEISRHRNGIDSQPVCNLRWWPTASRIELHRRWSGEFFLYYVTDPSVAVTSHLKFFKLISGDMDK